MADGSRGLGGHRGLKRGGGTADEPEAKRRAAREGAERARERSRTGEGPAANPQGWSGEGWSALHHAACEGDLGAFQKCPFMNSYTESNC